MGSFGLNEFVDKRCGRRREDRPAEQQQPRDRRGRGGGDRDAASDRCAQRSAFKSPPHLPPSCPSLPCARQKQRSSYASTDGRLLRESGGSQNFLSLLFSSFSVVAALFFALPAPGANLPVACAFGVVAVVRRPASTSIPRFLYAPPGSGYASRDDERSVLPDTYEPMMEYPGTMRPGKTPENMPFHDLPLDDDGPRDPVPWPHFQQISWHHQWEPPHEHPVPIEDFIERQGRWSTPELEARMRVGARQAVRDSRDSREDADRRPQTVITDDEDDEAEEADFVGAADRRNVALGEGVFGRLGSDADRAATAVATAAPFPRAGGGDGREAQGMDDSADDDDAGLDFLLDLGLDMLDLGDDLGAADLEVDAGGERKKPGMVAGAASRRARPEDDDDEGIEFDDEGVASMASAVNLEVDDEDVDVDDAIDFGVDEDDDEDGVGVGGVVGMELDDEDEDDLDVDDDEDGAGVGSSSGLDEVPLDDYGDGGDGLDNDIFDEGGFDYDDYDNDNDGGDMW